MEAALLKHCLAGLKQGTGAAAAFACAASQLQALSGPALRQSDLAADLADELLGKAETLLGSKQAGSRLLGAQLLRSTIADCHRRAFLQHHAAWAAALLAALRAEQQRAAAAQQQQQQQQPSAVAAEACAALAVYFARVGRMLEVPGLRRDGAAAASKLAAVLLQQGQKQQQQRGEDGAAAALPSLLALPQGQAALLAALAALPASFRQQHKQLEGGLLPLLMAPHGSAGLLPACVAALPRIAGDATAWSAFCQRLLATAHRLADLLLLGLDDSQLAGAARTSLDPSAEPLPGLPAPAAGGLTSEAYAAGFGQLEAVLATLRQLLSGSYPAAVPLPAGGLLLLANRLCSVDDGAAAGGQAAAAAAASSRFPQLCLQLPSVLAAALGMLQQALVTAGAAAAPYFVAAARLLSDLLQRSAAGGGTLATSALARCQLYATARQLLVSAGVGAVRDLSPALLQAAAAELYGRRQEGGAAEGVQGPARKRARKGQAAAAGDVASEAAAAAPLDGLGSAAQARDQVVQAAALQALEALCTAGAPLLVPQQRRQLDDLAAHVASTAAAAAARLACDAEAAVGPSLAGLQLAAYRLLLASLLAPAPSRPPHLAAALRLFRDGSAGGAASALPAFCRQALLSCEAVLHPRALPPPAPVRRVVPPGGEGEGGEGGAPLVMPRFWSSVDAGLLLQQEEAALERRRLEQPPQQAANGVEEDAHMAEAAEQPPAQQPYQQHQPQQAQAPHSHQPSSLAAAAPAFAPPPAAPAAPAFAPPPAAPAAPEAPARVAGGQSSMAALMGGPAPAQATARAQEAAAAAPLVPAALAPAPAALAAPVAAAAAAVAAAAAAEEESDSEGSLPEIDSGAESSGESQSDEA